MNYYLWINGAEQGPYDIEQIRTAIACGTIDAQQTARTEDSSDWKPLSQIARINTPKLSAPASKPVRPTVPKTNPTAETPAKPASTPSNSYGAITSGLTGVAILAFLAWKLTTIEHLLDKEATRPEFEYMVTAPKDYAFGSQMNALGKQGWEIVSARRATSGDEYDRTASYEVILKRQIR